MQKSDNNGPDWVEGDRKFLGKVQQLFLKNVPGRMRDLRNAVDADDMSKVELLSHTIKGSSAIVGAGELRDRAYAVEKAAMDGKKDVIAGLMKAMEEEFEHVVASFESSGDAGGDRS